MSEYNPFIFRYRVWYDLSIYFVSRCFEFYQQLSRNFFELLTDEKGIEHIALSHETKQNNWQGGLEATYDNSMYATRDPRCQVASLQELLECTQPGATSLFYHSRKETFASPQSMNIKHAAKSCKQHLFPKSTPDIPWNSDSSRNYTVSETRQWSSNSLKKRYISHIKFIFKNKENS